MTVQDDDQFLVCRNSTPYNLKSQNVMAELLDDDLMLVCRNGTPYKATGLEIKESIGPQEAPPSLTSVTLTEDTPGGSRFDNQSFTSTLSWATKGVPEASLEMKATVTGTLDIAGATDEITSFVDSPPTITNATQITSAVDQITVYDDGLVYSGAKTPEGILGLSDYPDLWTPVNPNPYKNDSDKAAGFKLIASQPLSITCIGSDPFKLLTTSNTSSSQAYSYTITGDVTVTGTTGGSQGRYKALSDEVTITPNTSGATFTITLNSGGMYINYVPLGGDTYFTFASDANLTNGAFVAGDVVKQNNSPITPTSSAITNVAAAEFSKVRAYYSSLRPNNLTEALQGTEYDLTLANTNVVENSHYVTLVCDAGCPTSGPVFASDGGPIFNMKYSAGGGNFTEDGTQLDDAANPPSGPANTLDILFSDGGTTGYVVNIQAAYTILTTMNLGTVPKVVSGATGNNAILTLTNDKDLNLFELGDIVQGENVSVTAINLSTPSITTDGGTWNTGEVVTGPAKDITATYVSADPAVPSMTVSDVVGPWSANTGNYVVNTVVNPIMIKPETSPIFAVGGIPPTDYIADCTWTENSPSQNAENAFNGTIDGTAWYTLSNTTQTFTRTIPCTTFEVYLVVSAGYSSPEVNGTSVAVVDGWNNFTSFLTDGKFEYFSATRSTGSSGIKAFRVDGSILVEYEGSVSLTLTDDTDLNQFAPGDNVYAGGVAPATFAPVIYTGNGTSQDITTGFAPDLVWIKSRTDESSHQLVDAVRGPRLRLCSNNTSTQLDADNVTAFNSDGFTVGSSGGVNGAQDYVAWCWSASDTTVANNEGSIESQVRSNGDFSIVTFNTGDSTATIGHGLSNTPAFIITKSASQTNSWYCYHTSLGPNGYVALNTSTAADTITGYWGTPDSTTFGVPTSSGNNLGDMLAYCWAESDTQSFGEYAGADAEQAIDLGFAPAFVLIKDRGNSEQWYVFDTARQTSSTYPMLNPNLADIEATTGSRAVELTDSGFTLKGTDGAINSSGRDYIYAAFAGAGGPSGVIGDITGLDMTLSESTGTWEVGQTVTMDEKPAVSTTANLIFDSTGAVSGLTTSDVAGQLMSNKDTPALTFGDGAGTGETWDEELPAGTHLQTSFVATNVEGTSSATSNEITPQ